MAESASNRSKLMGVFWLTSLIVVLVVSLVDAADATDDDCQLSTQELCDFDTAQTAAETYVAENPGVGVLIHVGQDFPNEHFENAEQFGQAVIHVFAQHGVQAQYFLSPSNAPNTGMTYYIGNLIHGQHNGTELKNVDQALAAVSRGLLSKMRTNPWPERLNKHSFARVPPHRVPPSPRAEYRGRTAFGLHWHGHRPW